MGESESFFSSIKKWFSAEASEAAEVKRDVSRRLDEDLTRREADLSATPSERLDNIQNEIEGSDSFEEIRSKIDVSTARSKLHINEVDSNDRDDMEGAESAEEAGAEPAEEP